MLLVRKDEPKWTSDEHPRRVYVMLTVAIWSTTPLNLFNVWRNDEIPSITPMGLSAPPTADAVRWTGAATMLISEMALLVASISWATGLLALPSGKARCL